MRKTSRGKKPARGKGSTKISLSKLSVRSQSARDRAIRAVGSMRHGATLSRAARENGVSIRTVQRYAGRALVQDRRGGHIRVAKSDRLVRYLVIPGPDGPREITVRGSKTASEFAKYKAAVNRFLRGERDALAAWHGKKIAGIELITAGNTLKGLAEKGLLPYSLYRSFAGGGR
jgi:hypothetical protein